MDESDGDDWIASKMGKEKRGCGMGCLERVDGWIGGCHG